MSDKRIIFTRPDGGLSVIIPAPGVPMERVMKDIPPDAVSARVVPVEAIPKDRLFRAAWRECSVRGIREDLDAAREWAHTHRRAIRSQEFAPLDQVIAAAIPGAVDGAEMKRKDIRDKHTVVQSAIDMANNVDQIRAAVLSLAPTK